MPRSLVALSVKEIRDMLRDPKILLGMILVPLLMFPIMGLAIRTSVSSVEESLKSTTLVVIDQDRQSEATKLIAFLRSYPSIRVNISRSLDEVIGQRDSRDAFALVIPEGFSANLTNGQRGYLIQYTVLHSVGVSASAQSSVISSLITAYGRNLTVQSIQEGMPGRDPASILNPIAMTYVSYLKGDPLNINPQTLNQVFISQSIIMPLVIMMLLIFSMQIAATSMAMEKEAKTLETLLTLPVSRVSILASKLSGSVFVSAIAAGAYMIGLIYYMESAMTIGRGSSIEVISLGLAISPTGFLLLGLSLFITLVAGLALAISISVLAEDVRGAQSLIGVLILPIVLPAIILMFADIQNLPIPLQLVLYAIPFTHPIIATKAALLADYVTIGLGIAYVAFFAVAVLYVAARLFSTEKIVTIKLTRRKPHIGE